MKWRPQKRQMYCFLVRAGPLPRGRRCSKAVIGGGWNALRDGSYLEKEGRIISYLRFLMKTTEHAKGPSKDLVRFFSFIIDIWTSGANRT